MPPTLIDAVMNDRKWNFCKTDVLVDQSRWFSDENEYHSQEYQVDVYENASTGDKTASVTITG